MARHEVKFSVPERPVGNVDIEFVIRQNNAPLGTLKVSRGGLEWWRKNAKKCTCKWSWQRVDELAEG